ncbi:MAG TPA: hypothetical protein VFS13_05330 [Steroidobacteraceae bacterium]|nr:hypothetical protein [Steroidobacteraceae bacterium]
MSIDGALLLCCLVISSLAIFPAFETLLRRRASRESSEVAAALLEYARQSRVSQCHAPLDPQLHERLRRLGTPEVLAFEFAQQLAQPDAELIAQAAQRLALRLKRRVAFERKMLARTAPGRLRGAVATAAPGIAVVGLSLVGLAPPPAALALLVAIELLGCWLLWRVARVEI